MKLPATLPAFTEEEYGRAHAFLAARVATMMGRKLEESDWTHVYCLAKNIPNASWSNLNIDVIHKGLGVEQKMLCVRSNKSIKEYCGTSRMHPSATRSIRIPSIEGDPTDVAKDILGQYAELMNSRRQKVAENTPDIQPDMRIGWLLWQESLVEFLYFEEKMVAQNPNDYWAEWKESGGGARKTSKNLWVYENKTGRKRYSITTTAGAKIQPYFDIPAPNDPNLYYFRVQGEEMDGGLTRIWITPTTNLLLNQLFSNLETTAISTAILESAKELSIIEDTEGNRAVIPETETAKPIYLTQDAYLALKQAFPGINDDHRVQLFIRYTLQKG